MNEIITVRDIDTITTEIKTIEMQVAKTAIFGCIEIGQRLAEAKEIVGHGGWGKYLAENVRYSQQWATNLMNLYREYGQQQESLFESFANSQSFENIDVSKHILLLAIPAEERAEFAEANDAEHKSVRELKAAIKERDEARADRDSNLQELTRLQEENSRITAGMEEAAEKLEQADSQIEELTGSVKKAEDKASAAERKVGELEKKLAAAQKEAKSAQADLEKAQKNPEIPSSVMTKLRLEAYKAATDDAEKKTAEELAKAKAEAESANQAKEAAERKLAAAQKTENPNMALFVTFLEQSQTEFNKLVGALKKINNEDPATGAKLKENIKIKLLEKLRQAIEEA